MDVTAELGAIVGTTHVLTDPGVRSAYELDWTRRFSGACQAVVRPASAAEVSAVLRACAAAGVPIVAQGGNTGLVGGSVPGPVSGGPAPVVLSTTRLTRLGPVDEMAAQVTAGAGVTLAALQRAAAGAGLEFPIDLAARDSATVGGMVATNAGGLHVLRYGSMRAQVVGLEAVLAGGATISRLSGLVKDNTGYDISQLLVGSEGTLAVITAARLRLVPRHPEKVVALLGLGSTGDALAVLDALRRGVEGLQAAEIFYGDGLEVVQKHAGLGPPLPRPWPVYLVAEAAGLTDPTDPLLEVLADLGIDEDATAVGTDPAGRARLWAYRERHTEAVSALGIPHKLDVTIPQSRLPEFESGVRKVVADTAPGSQLVLFGHVGDGNLHVNVVGPDPDDETVDDAVLHLVADMEGSISAEHGIGRAKARWLHLSRRPEEREVMKAIKAAMDPGGLLNPGVIFPAR